MTAFEGPEPGADPAPPAPPAPALPWDGEPDHVRARIAWAALRLAPEIAVFEALTQGLPAARSKLDKAVLRSIGEPLRGPALTMSAELALRIAAAAPEDAGPHAPDPPQAALPRFLAASAFLNLHEEHAPPLLGTQDDTVLTVGGFLLMAGEGGASKTTLTLDALAHLCSGTPWLGIPVPAPVRALVIENEGTRPKFRQKLEEKYRAWQGEPWLPNLFVYTAPWAQFSFADEAARADLRAFIEDTGVQLVAADPIDSLGLQGVGSPDETREFMGWLKDCGLFKTTAYWLLHHLGKGEQKSALSRISGAWGGHPDAVLLVQPDGAKRTRAQWVKMRWATLGAHDWLPADPMHLAWEIEQRGFSRQALTAEVTDDELWNRLGLYLEDNPDGVSATAVKQHVKGDNARLSALLKTAVENGDVENLGTAARPRYVLTSEARPRQNPLPASQEEAGLQEPASLPESGKRVTHEDEPEW